jgi:AcrR family transcriptional regulator
MSKWAGAVPSLQAERISMPRRGTNQTTATGDVRESLVRAAESCFERYGIAKTTMEDVAKAAGVSRWTVYRYFDDRDALILAVLLPRGRKQIERLHGRLEQWDNVADKLVDTLTFIIEESLNDEVVGLLLDPEYSDLTSGLLRSSEELIELSAGVWEPLIADGQQRGELRQDVDRREASRWLTMVGVTLAGRLGHEPDGMTQIRSLVRTFVLPAFLAPVPSDRLS